MAVIIGHASIDERGKANSGQAEDLAHHQRAHFRHGKSCGDWCAGVSAFAAHFKAAPSHRGG